MSKLKPKNKEHFKKQGKKSVLKMFDNVEDYISENTSINEVYLTNYKNIFLFFTLFLILILFVFVVDSLTVDFFSNFHFSIVINKINN